MNSGKTAVKKVGYSGAEIYIEEKKRISWTESVRWEV